ncbi:HAD-IIB family hydrolase [Ectothiorhodospiraceae bacterium 2226]|nr:HAD-IIB family hydrolase [Ectothiorhodospiraceae bacterium 2226]
MPTNAISSDGRLVLATDLDGTFLGGSDAQRAAFYEHINTFRDRVLLVFVTGRDLGFIRELCAQPGMPQPDYIIGDVGTTVVHGATHEPLHELHTWIESRWNGAGDRVRAMLADEPGIELQPTPFERRVSYYYRPDELREETLRKIEAAGLDWILSADVYLDVMPRGIAKGPTLLKFVEALGIDPEDVVACGDTLNDLSLFETGLKGVAVGNSEPRLVEHIRHMDNVYHSPHPGVVGIHDGLQVFGKQLEVPLEAT